MQKTLNTLRMAGIVRLTGVAGLLAFGASGAMAETFTGTAVVQSALVITKVADLDLGTLFATEASSGEYSYITFDPTGATSASAAAPAGGFQVLQLGTVTPASGTVAVGSQTQFDITLPAANVPAIATTNAALAMTATHEPVYLCAGGACGNTAVPRLGLVNFLVGGVTGGTLNSQTLNVAAVTPSFGSTSVGFTVGVTVTTDTNTAGAARTAWTYQDTTYTGSFEITAAY